MWSRGFLGVAVNFLQFFWFIILTVNIYRHLHLGLATWFLGLVQNWNGGHLVQNLLRIQESNSRTLKPEWGPSNFCTGHMLISQLWSPLSFRLLFSRNNSSMIGQSLSSFSFTEDWVFHTSGNITPASFQAPWFLRVLISKGDWILF